MEKLIHNSIKHLDSSKQNEILEYINFEQSKGHFYNETHIHAKDMFQSNNEASDVAKKASELNFDTLFLTQYGVAVYTWDFIKE